ncbi:MAG: tetratricopeptide repeat protein [Candidatus Gastranaerophilales bacterium]|nr:tetratricopeptide repeat protein [Candidatus Gastranaerophilales bacterium]
MPTLETLHQKAAALYEERKLQEALKVYEEIIATMCPYDEVALSCIMDIYLELDDKFNYYLARANVNIAQNKVEYAINDTKKALELDLDNIDARRKLARLYKVDNKILKAIDEFLKMLELSPKEIDAYFELVDLYMKEGSIDSAISIAKRGLEEFKDNPDIKNMLAQLYFKNNDFKSALEVVEDYMLRIKILLQDEQNEKAQEELSKINYNLLNDVQKKSYAILKAQYLYNTKDFENALKEIDNYSKIGAPDALSFQMRALIYEELNDEFNAHLNWGFCYKLQNKLDDALVEFDNAYRENQNNKTVLIELANLYQENKEKYVSIEFWQKVYDLDKDELAREILAEFYYSEGNFDKAQEYGKVIEKKEEKQENYEGFIDKIMNFFSKK